MEELKIISIIKKLSKRIIRVQKDGLYISYLKFISYYSEISFDKKYNTDTRNLAWSEDLTVEGENNGSHVVYIPSMILVTKYILKKLKKIFPPQSTFVDMGCGKGRVLLIASAYGFKKVKGVEFAKELYQISINNCIQYQKKHPVLNFQIIHADVENYSIQSDENIFYMYNSFGKKVLISMLNNIIASFKTNPRKIYIIYYYPTLSSIIENYQEFKIVDEINLLGIKTIIYQINHAKIA